MCTRCGAISWFGDTVKLGKLRVQPLHKEGEVAERDSEKPKDAE
jgi:hypothetical protein